ncbi:MAG: hypothetical protein UX30_C0007G0022 [Candidatus Saccharibacteria bacterium GW2011_GWA2_46_10]|nr:MAG: hypothetical protein UX30_C0007G0022 [Candidatus Saccharibacteria bacterium GW2011_GWA2_46_10]OGL36168.1 MAG: hypothetical protein A3F05_02605 [Candidatus Saccharibacteria bacterium RIFCSPHIGHO2_12_FULL_47_17]
MADSKKEYPVFNHHSMTILSPFNMRLVNNVRSITVSSSIDIVIAISLILETERYITPKLYRY